MAASATIARKYPATAHIPGLGPPGTVCLGCQHFRRKAHAVIGECHKATEFRGGKPIIDVPPTTSACKYYSGVEQQ